MISSDTTGRLEELGNFLGWFPKVWGKIGHCKVQEGMEGHYTEEAPCKCLKFKEHNL